MEGEDKTLQRAIRWLLQLASTGKDLENRTLTGLKVLEAQKGSVLCSYTVPIEASDKDGYWHVGAIATLADDVGAAAIYSAAGHVKPSVDFSISFYSQVQLHEEVEVEAKVVGVTGRLASVMVEVRRKHNGELVALGKQWMTEAAPKINKEKIHFIKKSKL
uniref:Acyl-coenzyme A thioesterase 13 n=1 Tax=Kalanchoe fedtschenkoi TaxID=63787 RepID=A0A7N0UZU5_KALFE